MSPGTLLPNGATVLDFKSSAFGNVVLAVWNKQPLPFIVWTSRLDRPIETDNGTYHANLEAAVIAFKRRA